MSEWILISKCQDGPLTLGFIGNATIQNTSIFANVFSTAASNHFFKRILFPSSIQSFKGNYQGHISSLTSGICLQKNWDIRTADDVDFDLDSLFTIDVFDTLKIKWKDIKLLASLDSCVSKHLASFFIPGLNEHDLFENDGESMDKYEYVIFFLQAAYLMLLASLAAQMSLIVARGLRLQHMSRLRAYIYGILSFIPAALACRDGIIIFPQPREYLETIGNEDLVLECLAPNAKLHHNQTQGCGLVSKADEIFDEFREHAPYNMIFGEWCMYFSSLFILAQKSVCLLWSCTLFTTSLPTLYIMNDDKNTVAGYMMDDLQTMNCNVSYVTPSQLVSCHNLQYLRYPGPLSFESCLTDIVFGRQQT